jgi:hypothetical protein
LNKGGGVNIIIMRPASRQSLKNESDFDLQNRLSPSYTCLFVTST